jgi:hypothetical protein
MILKLYHNWQEASTRKVYIGDGKYAKQMGKRTVKEITQLISKGKVIEEGENYTVYEVD